MVYSNLNDALKGLELEPNSSSAILEGELTDQEQIAECVCQCLIGNTHPKTTVKWVASYTKQLLAA